MKGANTVFSLLLCWPYCLPTVEANFNNDFIYNCGNLDNTKNVTINLKNICFCNIDYKVSGRSKPIKITLFRDIVISPEGDIKKSVIKLCSRNYLQGNLPIGSSRYTMRYPRKSEQSTELY
jgi:hypothetical protein